MKIAIISHSDAKIQAIKTVRTVTGLGLKEAKEAVDNLPGRPYEFEIDPDRFESIRAILNDGGVEFECRTTTINRDDFINALAHFPSGITVDQLRRTLIGTTEVF